MLLWLLIYKLFRQFKLYITHHFCLVTPTDYTLNNILCIFIYLFFLSKRRGCLHLSYDTISFLTNADMCDEAIKMTIDLGFRPALRWLARPTLIKELPAGRQIGYSLTYR